MLTWIVSTSLRGRVAVVALAALLLVFGVQRARSVPLDVFPEFAPPRVEIQTEAPGLSALEVETLVSAPLERGLQGTPHLQTLRSQSVQGLSSIVLILDYDAELAAARQAVQERLAVAAADLPRLAHTPVILPPLSATSRALKIGFSSQTLSAMEVSTLVRWTVRPRLMAVPGVANVALWGQRDRQLQVLVDPERLALLGVSLDQVVAAAGDAAALQTGGFLDTPNQRLPVRIVSALGSTQDLAATVVALRDGVPLLLGEVAEIVEDSPAPIGQAVIDDGPGILAIVEKEPWGNTLDVTRGVEAALAELAPGLAGVRIDSTIFRPATFIETALSNLGNALWIGCVLVVLVLVLFLYEWRAALISVVVIPLALVTAVLVLAWHGATLDTMVLAGLAIALGELVDDAIIDVENIMRRLRLDALAGRRTAPFRIVLAASLEVRSAVVFGSLIVVLVLVPVFFLEGLAGAFFRPLALAYVLAILASLMVALTVTPAMALLLLPRVAGERRPSPLLTRLQALHARIVAPVVARPKIAVGILALALLATLAVVPGLGEAFLPDFRERDFLMHFVARPGTSIDAMTRITERASRELRSIPGVRNFGAHIGRAEAADEVVGPNFAELWISLDPAVDYESTVDRVREVIDGYTGLHRDLLTYLRERIKEVLTGAGATLVVRIFGPELPQLREHATRVAQALGDIEGVSDLKIEQQVLVPEVEVRLRPDAMARQGLTPAAVREAATLFVKGARVGQFFEGQGVFDVVVWGTPSTRNDPQALRELRLETPGGGRVPLGELADVAVVPTPNQVRREDASRRIDVTCNVLGSDLGSVARAVERRVAELPFDRGYHPEVLGEYAARQGSVRRLLAFAGLSLLGILLILHLDFGSLRLALLVLVALPFALIGGVAGVVLSGGVLSLGSLIGFVTVFGIAARNAVLLISHYRHLEREEHVPFGAELLIRGARERLAPILMTALTTGLALLPLVVAGQRPGHEIEHPMAVVVLGGLVTSTLLNLLILPGLCAALGRLVGPGNEHPDPEPFPAASAVGW